MFSKNLSNGLIICKLQGIIKLQDLIKSNDFDYKSKRGKVYNFSKYALLFLKRYIRKKIDIRRSW